MSEYARISVCMCSHMRLVVRTVEGWTHVSSSGILESNTQPCQAGIYRFEFDRPKNSHAAVNGVLDA